MSIVEALVLGIVQGLTEFIPVSSSGHLIAGHELFGTTGSTLAFDVALHIGTLLALVIFFWRDLLNLLTHMFNSDKQGKLARIIIVATLPAATAGFLAADWIDETLRHPQVVIVTMVVMALAMLLAEKYAVKKRSTDDLTQADGLFVGVSQALALVPGVSRSGATITAGMTRGLKREAAARFSFLLAVPITAGAIAGSLLGAESGELQGQTGLFMIGIIASLLSGLIAIRFLMDFLAKNSLRAFAYYRLLFAAGLLIVLVLK